MQADNRPEPNLDLPLPQHLLAIALPYIQTWFIIALTIASHVPSAAVGILIVKTNPGESDHISVPHWSFY